VRRDLRPYSRAGFRLSKARQHRLIAANLHPTRQQILQRVRTGSVGISITIDVTSLCSRRSDPVQDLYHLAPIAPQARIAAAVVNMSACFRISTSLVGTIPKTSFIQLRSRKIDPWPNGLDVIRPTRGDDVLPAFCRRCSFARAEPTRQTVRRSVGRMDATSARMASFQADRDSLVLLPVSL
jgi:hypothetical protein